MICFYCIPHFGKWGNYPDPQDGGEPYVDNIGIGHVACCGRPKCQRDADDSTARQICVRLQHAGQALMTASSEELGRAAVEHAQKDNGSG